MGKVVVPVEFSKASAVVDGLSETLKLRLRRLAGCFFSGRSILPRTFDAHRSDAMMTSTISDRLAAIMLIGSSIAFGSLPVSPWEKLTNSSEPQTTSELDIT